MSPGADLRGKNIAGAEVCWTATTDGVVDEGRGLDKWEASGVIPQHRSDVVELSFVRDQLGCPYHVEDGLQSFHNNVQGHLRKSLDMREWTNIFIRHKTSVQTRDEQLLPNSNKGRQPPPA